MLGLAGLVAIHVFMLAGHGSGHAAPAMGVRAQADHAPSSPSLPLAPPPDDHGHGGFDLTVACLAVLAGLVLLGPRRAAQAAAACHHRPAASWDPAPRGWAGPRRRSLAELCISLT
jgi:hypothetical protein